MTLARRKDSVLAAAPARAISARRGFDSRRPRLSPPCRPSSLAASVVSILDHELSAKLIERQAGGVKIMEIKKDLMAASSTPLVLAILTEGDSYGYAAILQRRRELSGGHMEWTDGTLYPADSCVVVVKIGLRRDVCR